MHITITKIDDQTPKGLTTGFRLHLQCTADGKPFVLHAAILVSKDVLAEKIPLPNLVIASLQRSGLEEYVNELFVDSRRLNLAPIPRTEPTLPLDVPLGGVEVLNKKVLEKLAAG